VALYRNGKLERLYFQRRVTRLGESVKTTGRIKSSRLSLSVDCMKDFKKRALEEGAQKIVAVGTQALREAENREEFLDIVRRVVGIDIKIISPEEEAFLTLEGIKAGLTFKAENIIAFDIGGGSTEIIVADGERRSFLSVPLGVIKLSEFVDSYPLSDKTKNLISAQIKDLIKPLQLKSLLPPEEIKGPVLIGTGGTVTTLAGLDLSLEEYIPDMVHGHSLSLKRLEELLGILSHRRLEEIASLPGIEKGREDLIVPGLMVVIEIMKAFSMEELFVSDYGILEGIIIREALRSGE
jgi:exopolyphosphatase/guanosine-5'-triphosphate,3'-diphosphate pyrophosphatase